MSSVAASAFLFLSLPRELRDKIYLNILLGERVLWYGYRSIDLNLLAPNIALADRYLVKARANILLVNKQVNAEFRSMKLARSHQVVLTLGLFVAAMNGLPRSIVDLAETVAIGM
jgi:hypothetical protein